eukprot:EG_transcript_6689
MAQEVVEGNETQRQAEMLFPQAPLDVQWKVPAVEEVQPPRAVTFTDPIWPLLAALAQEQPQDLQARVYPLEEVLQLQFPKLCSRTLEVQIRTGEGLFSSINQVAGALAVAWRLNRTFILRGKPILYAPTELCAKGFGKGQYVWWNCLFAPLTHCKPSRALAKHTKRDFIPAKAGQVFMEVNDLPNLIRAASEIPPLTAPHAVHYANLLAFLFRPVQAFVDYAVQASRWLGLHNVTYASLHIRHTDKANTEFLFPTRLYLEHLARALPPAVATVFVLTDHAAVLREVANLSATDPRLRGLRFVSKPEARPEAGATIALHTHGQQAMGSPIAHTAEFLADILIALNSSLFIGSCSSFIGRSMMGLMAARTATLNTTVMVDAADCPFHAHRWFNFGEKHKRPKR